MATNGETGEHHRAVIGSGENFWIYDSRTGFDLTHPTSPDSPAITPRIAIQTTTAPIEIDPAKTALVIIDMQNYFLSPALGRARGAGHEALSQLVQYAVPAARKAGIRVLWVNWGLTDQEIAEMPPAILRDFGFEGFKGGEPVAIDKHGGIAFVGGDQILEHGRKGRKYKGMGSSMGMVTDPVSGKEIDAGKLLMRDQWNTALCPPLDEMYQDGVQLGSKPDVWIHKNRMSAMWGSSTACSDYLAKEGLKTLLFTGVNTDQCVGGTYQDCFSKGFDCILLNDGCGTTSPAFAQEMVEYNAANTWGFHTTCKAFAEGVEHMRT